MLELFLRKNSFSKFVFAWYNFLKLKNKLVNNVGSLLTAFFLFKYGNITFNKYLRILI